VGKIEGFSLIGGVGFVKRGKKEERINAEFAESAEKTAKMKNRTHKSWRHCVEWLPWSLHSAAGAPNCGAQEQAGRSGRDDRKGKREDGATHCFVRASLKVAVTLALAGEGVTG